MTDKDFHEQLREAGLDIIYENPEYLRKRIKRIVNKEPISFVRYCAVTRAFPNGESDKTLQINLDIDKDVWSVSIIYGHGDFHYNDFIHFVQDIEEVTHIVLRYYFGTATTINDWIVPFHRHPELNEKQVRRAIHEATVLTSTEFDALRSEYSNSSRLKQFSTEWERALESNFIYFFHQTDTQLVCAMRRNAKHAYIIPRDEVTNSILKYRKLK